jgi:hypothetical protein
VLEKSIKESKKLIQQKKEAAETLNQDLKRHEVDLRAQKERLGKLKKVWYGMVIYSGLIFILHILLIGHCGAKGIPERSRKARRGRRPTAPQGFAAALPDAIN